MVMLNGNSRKKVLLLCHYYPGAAGAIVDHIQAFRKYSVNEYFILSNLGDLPDWLDLSRFDAVIFHYSLIACYDNYISPAGRKRIREFSGYKAAFVQDDYRWINDTVNAFSFMGIHALFPLAGPDIIDAVYSPQRLPNVRKETVLAGYVPQELLDLPVKPYRERMIDVGYRARKLPAWMGSHTIQKWQIAARFLKDAPRYGLNVDLSYREEDRIYGDHWTAFVSNCKATLGTESGASICDFTGDIQRNVEAHLIKYPDTDFDTLRELYFKDEDCKFMMNVISPRCFEAAALKTLMILYEGRYSGVLVPWRHYVPLKRDHSNMDEIVHILQSPDAAQKIIDQAYDEVAKNENYSYSAMVRLVDRVMEEEWSASLPHCRNSFFQEEFEWLKKQNPQTPVRMRNLQIDMAFFFPVTKSASSTLSITGEGVHVGMSKYVAVEVPLHLSMSVKKIAIRWGTDFTTAPQMFEIQWLHGGKVVGIQSVQNPKQEAFQLIEMPSKSFCVDLLRIRVESVSGSVKVYPVAISILATEIKMRRRWLVRSKIMIVRMLGACWRVTPERIRSIVRPTVYKLRIVLRRLCLRLIEFSGG